MAELVLAGCPEVPLKAFRKASIGRGKPLTAKQADAAIAGAEGVLATGALKVDSRTKERELVPETMGHKIQRGHWYISQDLPVVIAREQGYRLTEEEAALIGSAMEQGCAVTYLQWDDESVDRVGGMG